MADGAHRSQNGGGHWKVKAGALFPYIGGSQVYRYGLAGIAETRIEQGRFDAFPAFPYGSIGHADSNEIAVVAAGIHVDLNVDDMCVYTLNSCAVGAEQCHSELVEQKRIRLKAFRWNAGLGSDRLYFRGRGLLDFVCSNAHFVKRAVDEDQGDGQKRTGQNVRDQRASGFP